MLTGQPPFKGATPIETIEQVCSLTEPVAPRRLQPKVPRDVETICMKCLRKEPKNRYATAQELADDLNRYFRHQPILAGPVPWWERLLKWCRRNPSRALTLGFTLLSVVAIAVIGWWGYQRQQAARADALVESLATANTTRVPQLLKDLVPYRQWTHANLVSLAAAFPEDSRERLHASLALVEEDPDRFDYLYGRMLKAAPDELVVIRDALKENHRSELTERLWKILAEPGADGARCLHAACALADDVRPNDPRWQRVTPVLAEALLKENPLLLGAWTAALRPVSATLVEPLGKLFHETQRPESERSLATFLLADFGSDRPEHLVNLLLDTNSSQFALLWPALRKHPQQTIPLLHLELEKAMPAEDQVNSRDALAKRQAWAAVALLQLGEAEPAWRLLRLDRDPSRRTYLIHALGWLGTDPDVVIRQLACETDVSIRRALILCLGEFSSERLSRARRQALADLLTPWYRDDPDAGIHSACDWLLRNKLEHGSGPNNCRDSPL